MGSCGVTGHLLTWRSVVRSLAHSVRMPQLPWTSLRTVKWLVYDWPSLHMVLCEWLNVTGVVTETGENYCNRCIPVTMERATLKSVWRQRCCCFTTCNLLAVGKQSGLQRSHHSWSLTLDNWHSRSVTLSCLWYAAHICQVYISVTSKLTWSTFEQDTETQCWCFSKLIPEFLMFHLKSDTQSHYVTYLSNV